MNSHLLKLKLKKETILHAVMMWNKWENIYKTSPFCGTLCSVDNNHFSSLSLNSHCKTTLDCIPDICEEAIFSFYVLFHCISHLHPYMWLSLYLYILAIFHFTCFFMFSFLFDCTLSWHYSHFWIFFCYWSNQYVIARISQFFGIPVARAGRTSSNGVQTSSPHPNTDQ